MKIKVIFFLLFSLPYFAQDKYSISPSYGRTIVVNTSKYYPQEVTYNDMNSIVMLFSRILDDIGVVQQNSVDKTNDNGDGFIIYHYSQPVGTKPKKIIFKYNVFIYNDLYVVKDISIQGDFDLVTKFYLKTWDTNINYEQSKKGGIFTSKLGNDDITYQYKGGLSYIKITNRLLKNEDEFSAHYENSKKDYFDKEKIKQIEKHKQDSIASKKYEQSTRQKTITSNEKTKEVKYKPNTAITVIYRDKNVKVSGKYSEKIVNAIEKALKPKKKGVYSIFFKDLNADVLEIEKIILIQQFNKHSFF